jgi:hypothetical protein
VGSRAGLDTVVKRKIPSLCRDSNHCNTGLVSDLSASALHEIECNVYTFYKKRLSLHRLAHDRNGSWDSSVSIVTSLWAEGRGSIPGRGR